MRKIHLANNNDYISFYKDGTDVYIRYGDTVLCFDTFKDMFKSIDQTKATYKKTD